MSERTRGPICPPIVYANTPPPTVILSCREVARDPIETPQRSTFCFDLSGVKYQSRNDILERQRQWETFERIENYNSIVLKKLSETVPLPGPNGVGTFISPSFYVFKDDQEKKDHLRGQILHGLRYPDISNTFVPYSTRPIQYTSSVISTLAGLFPNEEGPVVFSIPALSAEEAFPPSAAFAAAPVRRYNPGACANGRVVSTVITNQQRIDNTKALNIYVRVSTFNAQFPKSNYKFSSNEEFLMYKKYKEINC